MMHFKKLILAGASLLLLAAMRPALAGVAADAEALDLRISKPFIQPRSPESFRALSGMGLPKQKLDRYSRYESWGNLPDDQKVQLRALMPDVTFGKYSFGPDFGACRLEGPLAQYRVRLAQLGNQHPYVAQWLSVERAVLSACGSNQNISLPGPMPTSDPKIAVLQQQDRLYQQAVLLFYTGGTQEALPAFQAIMSDRKNPNRPFAVYMVLAIHAGSSSEATFEQLKQPEGQVLASIQAALADPSLESVHGLVAGLIGYVGYYSGSDDARKAQVHEAIMALLQPTAQLNRSPVSFKRYAAAMSDIESLHRFTATPDWVLTGNVPSDFAASTALAALARREPMAAWVAFPTNPYLQRAWVINDGKAQSQAVRDYLAKMGGDGDDIRNPWVHENSQTKAAILTGFVDAELVRLATDSNDEQAAAALGLDFYNLIRHRLTDGDDRRAHFEDAVLRLQRFPYKKTTPFTSVVADGFKYLVAAGRLTEARQMRDALKLDRPADRENRIYLQGALMLLAENEDQLIRAMATQGNSPEYLNQLPTQELWRLADRSDLKREQRTLLVRVAWSRDYALKRTISWRHDQLFRSLAPEITAHSRAPRGRDVKPGDLAVMQDVLNSPGLNIEIKDASRSRDRTYPDWGEPIGLTGLDYYNKNDGNWWCAWGKSFNQDELARAMTGNFGLYFYDSSRMRQLDTEKVRRLLTPAMRESFIFRSKDMQEQNALSHIPCATERLGAEVFAWVRGTGPLASRAGQAEALANVVVMTRYSCNRKGSRAQESRTAYNILHARFSDTDAAKRTRYWFH